MRANLLKDRIQIQQRTVTEGAIGSTLTWRPIQHRFGRVIPLSATARAEYQQLGSNVSHKIIFEKGITLNLADYRFKHLDKTYQPTEPPIVLDDNTAIVVKEL
ncbi:MAG: head-tail adaptor protein [Ignavibacteria bacterium]|nr:head-tail adaptor protein [Ignavibacteria bacterium]